MSDYSIDPQTIVDFWRELGKERWFAKDDEVDATIRSRFEGVHERAAAGELDDWAEEPNGALALVILLDQFSRNMYRGSPRMFESDAKALAVAARAIERGDQDGVGEDVNQFFAMPFMHAEDLKAQETCIALMRDLDEDSLVHAVEHRDVIAKFGRFPHRNTMLGRSSTPEEEAFLAQGGFAG